MVAVVATEISASVRHAAATSAWEIFVRCIDPQGQARMIAGPQCEVSRSLRIEQELINLAPNECISNIANTKGHRVALPHTFLELVNDLQLPGYDDLPKC